MKKFYALSLLIPFAFIANARQLSPQEALARLNSPASRSSESNLKINDNPVFTLKKNGLNTLYVFNQTYGGYVVVSGDDCAAPLLGYSDSGNFDVNNLPPQLQWWLDFYSREIEYAAGHGMEYRNISTRSDMAPISPMLSTRWDQGSPYNDDCPSLNGSNCVTGCVATAMAQTMKYHNYPQTGSGQNSYSWNNQTLSMNFSNVNFDWSNMTDTYGSASTQKEIDAVAQLMYACGISVNMDYTASESGASAFSVGPALYQYFGYSSAMVMPSRAFFSSSDWNNLIYNQLAAGMPVLYGGQSDEGGHEFVCDGYSSDGYFHFNWGWSGMSDGYYLLSALDPMTQGIGGSTGGFNYNQSVVLNVAPAGNSATSAIPAIYCYGDFSTQSSSTSLGQSVRFTSGTAFYNFGVTTLEVTLGLEIKDASGNSQYVAGGKAESYKVLSGYTSFNATLPQNLSNGTYTLSPVYKTSGSDAWMKVPVPLSAAQTISMTVSNGRATFSNNSPKISVTDLSLNSNIYLDTNFKASFTVQNNDENEYYAQLMFGLMNSNGQEVTESSTAIPVDLKSGESTDVEYITEFASQISSSTGTTQTVQPGSYILVLFDMVSGNVVYEYPQMVTVAKAPSNTQLSVSGFGLADGSTVASNPEDIEFTGNVQCVDGYYADQLIVAVFPKGATSTSIEGSSDYLFLEQGQSSDFSVSVSVTGATPGEEYFAVVYTADKKELTQPLYFTIGNFDAGVSEISGSADAVARYYTLDGVEVSKDNLNPGLYILRQGHQSKKILITR